MEETLGKRIAARRKGLGLTQDALAEKLGVTAQAVSKWENDQSCPDITMLPKLAEVFDATTDELLGVPRKKTQVTQALPEEPLPSPEPAAETASPHKWQALTAPGAAFAFWLFLTGMVSVMQAFQLARCEFGDISIACGIFTFGLFGFLRNFSVLRLGCAVGGGIFVWNLLTQTGLADIDWYIPLAAGLALLGLDLLIHTIRKSNLANSGTFIGHIVDGSAENYCTYDGEQFTCATCFSQGDRQIRLPRLSGGSARAAFGELNLDITHCGEITNGCCIGLECAFGSLEILVPRTYRVACASSSVFGTVETKGAPDADAETTVSVNCKVSFGQITIRYC